MFRATKIGAYVKAFQRRGISAKRLLAGTNIDIRNIPHSDYMITLEQYEAVVANMMELTGNPGVAFTVSDILIDVRELGILGYAMLSANSLRQAVAIWMEYSNSLAGTPTNIESTRDISPGYEMTFSSPLKGGVLHRFETEELLIHGMERVTYLTGIRPVISKVSFSYPEPPHSAMYREHYQCPVVFDAPKTVVRVLQPELDVPIKTRNEELFQICAQHCQKVMRLIPEAGILRSQLRSLFLLTPANLPDLCEAGLKLGLSVSTLRRQLDASGQSYQAVKDEFRFDLAREYLLSGHMSSKQVAYLLGFQTPSAFARAFKGWSGQTVGDFLDDKIE
jgi:AraC-like DNA-binding protein